jgi:hypothetical protein
MADRGHHTLIFGPPVWLAKSHQIDLFEEKTRLSLPMLATGARYGELIALRAAPKRPHAATCMLARSMGQIGLELERGVGTAPASEGLLVAAPGTERTCRDVRLECAFGGKPDLTIATADFRV